MNYKHTLPWGEYKQTLQFVGEPQVVFGGGAFVDGFAFGSNSKCETKYSTFDTTTAVSTVVINKDNVNCTSTVDLLNTGSSSGRSASDEFNVKIDHISLSTALAVNEGLLSVSELRPLLGRGFSINSTVGTTVLKFLVTFHFFLVTSLNMFTFKFLYVSSSLTRDMQG